MTGRDTVNIVLLSDPDLPAELADRLVLDLPDLLTNRVSADVKWRVDEVLNPLAGDEQVSVSQMVEVVGTRMPELGWDYGVCLTDLPRRAGRRPVVAELSTSSRVALVSVPALGTLRLYPRVREAVVRLVAELVAGRETGGDARPAERVRQPRDPLGHSEEHPEAGTVFVVPGARGQLRLLAGMVRANRPWRLFLGLSKTLAGVFAAAAFAVLQSDVWRLATALGPVRQSVVALTVVAALVTWLIVDHELWERPAGRQERHRAVMYNAATAITLTLGVLCLYVVVLGVLAVTVTLVLTPDVLAGALRHVPQWSEYADIIWFTSSASMVGGALGAGLEDDSIVRQAAYGERQRQRQRQNAGPP
jgi:hypothetical protein